MRTKNLFLSAGICLAFLFTNCAKDGSSPHHHDEPTMNYLCTGQSGVFYPMKEGNSWSMYSATGTTVIVTIKGVKTFNGQTYNVLENNSGAGVSNQYYRVAANGDVYKYVIYDNSNEFTKEYLVIPNAAIVGTEWEYAPTVVEDGKPNKRVITSVNSTIQTDKCEYKDVFEIKEYKHDGILVNILYFKPGLGLIREVDNLGQSDLVEVTLK